MLGSEICDISNMIDVETIETHGGSKKREISGRIIENAGKQASTPIKARIVCQVKIESLGFHVIEHRDHRAENSEKNPGDFNQRLPTELVRFKDARRS